MNRNFAGRPRKGSRQAQAQHLSAAARDDLPAETPPENRERRRRTQRLVLLGLSIVTLFSLAGMIITRAMEIASL
ncbi:hypothetical protein PVT71_11460 [Salipiger sp. H15]|uniref:Uncharacterized protein n=1 Tax=Alloyangia sp. H15 TaxID=3029062 RepID=A0AAU8AF24_9RHOB